MRQHPAYPGIRFDGYDPATAAEVGIIPKNGKIIVELVRFQPREIAGVFLDATTEDVTENGIVRAVAEGSDTDVQVGDVVLFGRYSGYSIEEERFAVLRPEDIVGVRTHGIVKPKDGVRPDSGLAVPEKKLLLPH